jgi:DNA-binding NtrC family response regulator
MAKILVVEDEATQRLLYETEISDMGHEVLLAKDGLEAVNVVRKHRPEMVILDLMMPNMHGLDSLKKVLSINPNTLVIIHTAYSHYKDHFMSWAAQEYIVKSADLSELKKAIARVLAGRPRTIPSGRMNP